RLRAPRVLRRSEPPSVPPPELRMTDASAAACRRALDEALAADSLDTTAVTTLLASAPADALDAVLRDFADVHTAAALPLLVALGDGAHGGVRRAAKRALYRLSQRGIA